MYHEGSKAHRFQRSSLQSLVVSEDGLSKVQDEYGSSVWLH